MNIRTIHVFIFVADNPLLAIFSSLLWLDTEKIILNIDRYLIDGGTVCIVPKLITINQIQICKQIINAQYGTSNRLLPCLNSQIPSIAVQVCVIWHIHDSCASVTAAREVVKETRSLFVFQMFIFKSSTLLFWCISVSNHCPPWSVCYPNFAEISYAAASLHKEETDSQS